MRSDSAILPDLRQMEANLTHDFTSSWRDKTDACITLYTTQHQTSSVNYMYTYCCIYNSIYSHLLTQHQGAYL